MPCWHWKGNLNQGGYGYISIKDAERWRTVLTHRLAYTIFMGEVPSGLDLDHLCRNRRCWNPWHLEPVTRLINVRRGIAPQVVSGKWQRGRTHCPQGHPYSLENTARRNGRRHCRACDRDRMRRSRQKQKSA
ncbi:HNH endonuclease signature motif containing protein [Streptomyces sp. BE133]|uniref:HNH endonuclease signature motif containing protein n=1 Tax=Streptomyces sp. BE133 TaxID=3002523 RepID=UPI003FA78B26